VIQQKYITVQHQNTAKPITSVSVLASANFVLFCSKFARVQHRTMQFVNSVHAAPYYWPLENIFYNCKASQHFYGCKGAKILHTSRQF